MATNHYVTDGAIGIDLNSIGSARAFTLGETHKGDGGSEWVYVLARSSTTLGACVAIADDYGATSINVTVAASQDRRLGFCQTAFPASTYGFVALSGQNILVRLLGGMAGGGGQPLYLSNTDGALSTASGSATNFQVFGVWLHSSASAGAATAAAFTAAVSFPHLRKPRLGGG